MDSPEEPNPHDEAVATPVKTDGGSESGSDDQTITTRKEAEVERNVIPAGVIVIPISSSSPTTTMQQQVLADIAFHSPSSEILGTPFSTTDSARFEYPFPDVGSSSGEGHSPSPMPPSFTSSPGSGSMHPQYPSSSQILNPVSPRIDNFKLPPSRSKHSPTHPKMQPPSPPPVPPGLAKKLQRWSLGILRRKSVSKSNVNEGGSLGSPTGSDSAGEVVRSTPGRTPADAE